MAVDDELNSRANTLVFGGLVNALRRNESLDTGPKDVAEWFKERLTIRTKSGQMVNFEVNPVQQKLIEETIKARAEGRPPHFLILKSRRFGVTTFEQGRNYHAIATKKNCEVVTLAHTSDATKKIFKIARLMAMKDWQMNHLQSDIKTREITLKTMNSTFTIGTAGSAGFGRGDTLQRVHGSEVSRWCEGPNQVENQEELISGLTEAASEGEVALETTPKGVEWFCITYRDAKNNLNDWTPLFFPWWTDPTYRSKMTEDETISLIESLNDEENLLIEGQGLDHEQINWRRKSKRRLGRLFPQEYPEDDESCFLQSGTCYFDREKILPLLQLLPEIEHVHIPGGYICYAEKPIPGVEYVAGVDTSEGLPGCDPNGIGILRKDTGQQVAWAHGLFKPRELARLSVKMCKQYNNAFLGVERNNHGHAVLEKVKDYGYSKKHQCYYMSKDRIGWETNSQTRPIMLEELSEAIDEGFMKVADKDFLGECMSFNMQSDGKFEADSGTHDDRVMYWAVAWQMRKAKRPRVGMRIVDSGKQTQEEQWDALKESTRK